MTLLYLLKHFSILSTELNQSAKSVLHMKHSHISEICIVENRENTRDEIQAGTQIVSREIGKYIYISGIHLPVSCYDRKTDFDVNSKPFNCY